MTVLSDYITQTQLLVHDAGGVFATNASYISWINTARNQAAIESQCVRRLEIVPTVTNQETYHLPTISDPVTGVDGAIGVTSIAVPWSNLKPVLDRYNWTKFQALCRVFSQTQTGNPSIWAQYQNQPQGLVYMFPIPQQVYAAEWDCWCTVLPLADDTSVEAIPYPFTDAIPYFAAYLACMNRQSWEDANGMMKQYQTFIRRARAFTIHTFSPTSYPVR